MDYQARKGGRGMALGRVGMALALLGLSVAAWAQPTAGQPAGLGGEEALATGTSVLGNDFRVSARVSGFQPVGSFLEFLESGRRHGPAETDPLEALLDRNVVLFLLALLGGGVLLNLTPCVLPMIPINLGIIGAGAQASSRGRGFLLGGAYGLGIMVAYGALGLVSVVGGAAFGSLQSSPWFSAGVALVFLVLALALFDVWAVDLSRFQRVGSPARKGSFGAAAGIGAVSALLAGACVAPVLISTLMLSATLYRSGRWAGVLLPFVLGLGMALPWPFAGAGLTFLPKPGAWMRHVKQGFGVLVVLFALHYARLAYEGFAGGGSEPVPPEAPSAPSAAADAGVIPWRHDLGAALAESKRTGRPVLVDLWATWCTACAKMDRSTLRDPQVVAALGDFIPLKVQCERPKEPATAALMKALDALGLPTYVVLQPRGNP